MPAKSPAQFRFMAGIAHGMKPHSGIGPSPEVAEEFVKKTPKKKRSLFMKKSRVPSMKPRTARLSNQMDSDADDEEML